MINKYIRFIDVYLCSIIHNPIATSALLVISAFIVNSHQISTLYATKQYEILFAEDYVLDVVSNLFNILFVVRFQLNFKLPVALEAILFLAQNVGCGVLLMNTQYSFLYRDSVSLPMKACLLCQILFPFVILLLNVFDSILPEREDGHNDNEKSHHTHLFDSNNNYLPIFISHSFLFVNTNFPTSTTANTTTRNAFLVYTLCQFSYKFYLIYQFILYEIASILYNHTSTNYGSLYEPVSSPLPLHHKSMKEKEEECKISRKRSDRFVLNEYRNHIMLATCVGLVAVDSFYIWVGI